MVLYKESKIFYCLRSLMALLFHDFHAVVSLLFIGPLRLGVYIFKVLSLIPITKLCFYDVYRGSSLREFEFGWFVVVCFLSFLLLMLMLMLVPSLFLHLH